MQDKLIAAEELKEVIVELPWFTWLLFVFYELAEVIGDLRLDKSVREEGSFRGEDIDVAHMHRLDEVVRRPNDYENTVVASDEKFRHRIKCRVN